MSNFEDQFKLVLAQWLRNKGMTVYEVTDYYTSSYESGYCETCAYTAYETQVYYRESPEYVTRSYTYDGTLANLIQELP